MLIGVEASVDPKQTLRVKFTPTETGSNYLRTITQDGTSKGANVERYVDLTFTRANSGDPWRATIRLETQEADALGGTIAVQLVDGTDYTTGIPAISTITVSDTTIPALSIARAPDTLAGEMAEFVITSSIPFNKSLNVVYNPSNVGGNHLNESDGDTAGAPNRRSGLDRTIELDFNESNGNYVAILSFATQDDPGDNDGGAINVELKTNAGDAR